MLQSVRRAESILAAVQDIAGERAFEAATSELVAAPHTPDRAALLAYVDHVDAYLRALAAELTRRAV